VHVGSEADTLILLFRYKPHWFLWQHSKHLLSRGLWRKMMGNRKKY